MQPVRIETGSQPILVVGHHLVSQKMMDIVNYLLRDTDFGRMGGVEEFHFTENFPEGKFGAYDHKTKSVVINLQHHFDATAKAIRADKDNTKYLSFRTMLWYDLLTTICHELFHGVAWSAGPAEMEKVMKDPEAKRAVCEDCNDNANEFLIELFRDFDVEAPPMAEEPFFGPRFMQFFINEIKDGGDEWAIRQNIMQENNFVYFDEERDDSIISMREWLRSCKDADPDFKDERWDAEPQSLKVAQIVAEEQAQADVIAEAKAQAKPVATDTEIPWKTDDIDDPELLMEMSMDITESAQKDAETVPTADELPAPQMGAPTPHPSPNVQIADTVEPDGSVCLHCKLAVPPGGKFCCHCGQPADTAPQVSTIQTIQNLGAVAQPTATAPPAAVQPVQPVQRQFTQNLRTNLPDLQMSQETMRYLLEQVYIRMHNHCFTKCGFQTCGGQTGRAVGWDNQMVNNILEPIPIGDIVCPTTGRRASELVIAYDKFNPQTNKNIMQTPIINGMISGWVAKTSGVPHYCIYVNNNGTEVRRIFSPQNAFSMNKPKTDYSENAKSAQNGAYISWVWIGNADGTRTWYYKIENGSAKWLV